MSYSAVAPAPSRLRPAPLFAWALVGVALVAVAAQISVPMQPVPMTLQTFAMFAVAMLGGARLGLLVALGYFVAAWLGAPVLSGGASFAADGLLDSKTAGYVVAFVPACWLLGGLVDLLPRSTFALQFGAALLAHALVLLLGAAWLAGHVGVARAFDSGVLPFLLGALAKSFAVALLVAAVRRVQEPVRR